MSADLNRAQLDGYLDSLQSQRQLAALTVDSYRRDLDELTRYVEALPGAPAFASVTQAHIRKFAAQMHGHGLGPRSIARKLSAWRGFYHWLGETVELARNPVLGIKSPKRNKPLPKALSADDAVHLVSHASVAAGVDAHAPTALCNRAMFELLYSSGLRVSELTALDLRHVQEGAYSSPGWIDFDAHVVTVTGKGGKMRSVPVGAPALVAIAAWIAVRPALVKTDAHPLFLTERGTRMSPRVVQLRIKAHAQKLGIPADVHPHVLRHSFASHVLQSSGDLRAVQEMLGHASITSTQIYTSLDFQRLAQVYDAAHPRAKKRP
jgi:integrase/recombinase XerC